MSEMKSEDPDRELRSAFAELVDESSVDPPTAKELTGLREGTSDDEEAQPLIDRAAQDATTARLLLDAKQFPDLEPTAEERAAIEAFPAADGWRSLRDQLRQDGGLELAAREIRSSLEPAATAAAVPAIPKNRRPPEIWAIAASLLVGIGLGLVWPRRGPDPVINPTVIELAGGIERGGGGAPRLVRSILGGLEVVIDVADFAADDGPFELGLIPEDAPGEPRSFPEKGRRYRDTVRVVWSEMPRPGVYRIELRRGGQVLDHYRIQITD